MIYIIPLGDQFPTTQLLDYNKMRPDVYYILHSLEWEEVKIICNTRNKYQIENKHYNLLDYNELDLKINENDILIIYNTPFINFWWLWWNEYKKQIEFINRFNNNKVYTYVFDLNKSFSFKMINKICDKFNLEKQKTIDIISNSTFLSWNLYNRDKMIEIYSEQWINVKEFIYIPVIWNVRNLIEYKEIKEEPLYDTIYYWTTRWWARNKFIKKYYEDMEWNHLLIWPWNKILNNDNHFYKSKTQFNELYNLINNSKVSIMTWDESYYNNSIHHRLIELSLCGTLILIDYDYDIEYKIFWEENKHWYIENKEDVHNMIKFLKNNPKLRTKYIKYQRELLEQKFNTYTKLQYERFI